VATAPASFDLDAMNRAFADHDVDAAAAMYTEDAEISMVDQSRPPSRPAILRGRDEIAEMLRDVMSRDLTHDFRLRVAAPDAIAYEVACRYGDGTRVLVHTIAELRDGRIAGDLRPGMGHVS
jgi:ketosteroid isomerase-like protein